MNTNDYKSFAYLESGDVNFTQFATIKSSDKLESGAYVIDFIEHPRYEVSLKVNNVFETVKTHDFSDKQKIDNLLNSFFNIDIKDKVESLGFCYKTGVLLYGNEGTGKSTIIKYYCNLAITKYNAIVFHFVYGGFYLSKCWEFIQNIRRIQDNPIIVVFDEFDTYVKDHEAFLKTMIDGNLSISNCLFFAATNYLDRIPQAMTNRPSRFKYCLNIEGVQVLEDVINIITPLLKDFTEEREIKKIANELKGNSLDYIKHYCLDKIMSIQNYEKSKKKIGFLN